jgi:hypothetical protein
LGQIRVSRNTIETSCQKLIDNHWKNFGMEKKYWDGGWGFHDACNNTTPLNRTLRSLELLKISKNSAHGEVVLNYAYDESRKAIKKLRVGCAKNAENRARASARSGTVYLYQTIFSDNVVGIAGTLLHEARHRKKGHNGGDKCPRKLSCDKNWSYSGANAWQVNYLWWYGVHSKNSQKFMRQLALNKAKNLHDRAFVTNPGLSIPTLAK